MERDNLIAVIISIGLFAVVVIVAIILSPAQEEIAKKEVVIIELWDETTMYGNSWYLVTVSIDGIPQRPYEFRSIETRDAWLESIRKSPLYVVKEPL